jgi:hypothetical protein
MQDGGEGGRIVHEDVRRRLSEISKTKWRTREYQERWRKAMAGNARFLSDEEREQRKQKRQRNLETRRRNMAIHAARLAEAEEKKRWVFVPLTHNATAFVPLTNGKWALIDKEDWERVGQHRWSANIKSGRKSWRVKTNIQKVTILLNRYLMGARDDEAVRHKNGNQLDCRRCNLHKSCMGMALGSP